MNRKVPVRLGGGEKVAITSKPYLFLYGAGYAGRATLHNNPSSARGTAGKARRRATRDYHEECVPTALRGCSCMLTRDIPLETAQSRRRWATIFEILAMDQTDCYFGINNIK